MNLHFGVCTGLSNAPAALQAGCAFIEPSFTAVANMVPEQFRENAALVASLGLPVPAMNGMIPPAMSLYTPEVSKTIDFVKSGMERAGILGVKTLVFGSGTARSIPLDMDADETTGRLCLLLHEFSAIAAPYGIRLAVEPLRREETNLIHTLSHAAALASRLPPEDKVGINADIFHIFHNGEPPEVFSQYRDLICHVHICSPERGYPLPGRRDYDDVYRTYLRAAARADGCNEVSVEGHPPTDLPTDLPGAIAHLTALANNL